MNELAYGHNASYGVVFFAPEDVAQTTVDNFERTIKNLSRLHCLKAVSYSAFAVKPYEDGLRLMDAMGEVRQFGDVVVVTNINIQNHTLAERRVYYCIIDAARAWKINHRFGEVKIVFGANFDTLNSLIDGSLRGKNLKELVQSKVMCDEQSITIVSIESDGNNARAIIGRRAEPKNDGPQPAGTGA